MDTGQETRISPTMKHKTSTNMTVNVLLATVSHAHVSMAQMILMMFKQNIL